MNFDKELLSRCMAFAVLMVVYFNHVHMDKGVDLASHLVDGFAGSLLTLITGAVRNDSNRPGAA